jgi:outer membrane protein assembly factor BamC
LRSVTCAGPRPAVEDIEFVTHHRRRAAREAQWAQEADALIMHKRFRFLPLLLLPVLAACGGSKALEGVLPDQSLEYKRQREASENLELPPDLAGATFDDALDIPSGSATYSEYSGGRAARQQIAGSGAVLPEVAGVTLERSGDKRWLEVNSPPQSVWPRLVAFWREQGILLVEQDPAVGVMKTDWLENRAEVRNDFVTRQLRKVVDGLYATSTRDQYRVRVDAGRGRDSTEVFLTHRAMEERLVRNSVGEGATTVWEPAPGDPEKEAAMLRRLMLFLGVSDRSAQRMLASGGSAAATASAGARLVQSAGGSELVIPAEFRQAWRQTGLALDRTGFAVEDRDRTDGVFYVRYDDPNRNADEKKGIVSRLAFWKDGNIDRVQQYRVKLIGGSDETRVTVLDSNGQRDTSATGERILSLLHEQLR